MMNSEFTELKKILGKDYKKKEGIIILPDYAHLVVTENQSGGFYKARLNNKRITERSLIEMIPEAGNSGMTWDYWMDRFKEKNPKWRVEVREIDVS